MNERLASPITDIRPCVPSDIQHVNDVHQVAGPLAFAVLMLAALVWIVSMRFGRNSHFGLAKAAEVVAALVLIVGLLCVAVWGLTFPC